MSQHLLRGVLDLLHCLGKPLDPTVLPVLAPLPTPVIPYGEIDILVRFWNVLGVRMATQHPPPGPGYQSLLQTGICPGIGVSGRISLIRKRMQMVIYDHRRISWRLKLRLDDLSAGGLPRSCLQANSAVHLDKLV